MSGINTVKASGVGRYNNPLFSQELSHNSFKELFYLPTPCAFRLFKPYMCSVHLMRRGLLVNLLLVPPDLQ